MNRLPVPIQHTLIKMILLGAAILAFGIIWGIASRDRVLLLLSGLVGALYAVKTYSLYRTAAASEYEVVEGMVLSDRAVPLRGRHQVILEDGEQTVHKIMLTGRSTLRPGQAYRLYISGREEEALQQILPDQLCPARSMLGYERLE